MKKNNKGWKIVIYIFCLTALILACGSCSNSSKNFTGNWTVTDISFSDSGLADEIQLMALEYAYKDMTLELNEDNSGSFHYLSKDYQITWEQKNGKHWDIINIYLDGVLWQEFDAYAENDITLTIRSDIVVATVSFGRLKSS